MTTAPALDPQQMKELVAALQNANTLAGQYASLRMASDEQVAEVRFYLEKISKQLRELDELCMRIRK